MCIGGGYDFCWKSDVGGKVLGPEKDPKQVTKIPEKNSENVIDLTKTDHICCENE